ncbi:MAG: HPr family phosphocarrier protein [Candidatus Aminicenantes bacterium]|nr:HPr family phosphocarrier protein [Candidatus Aminicenantes bacterium]
MVEEKVEISNKLGLHARAAAKLSHLANSFQSDIFLIYNSDRVNAKSLLGILTLAASVGTSITISAAGKDEQEAVTTLADLFHRKFDEEN